MLYVKVFIFSPIDIMLCRKQNQQAFYLSMTLLIQLIQALKFKHGPLSKFFVLHQFPSHNGCLCISWATFSFQVCQYMYTQLLIVSVFIYIRLVDIDKSPQRQGVITNYLQSTHHISCILYPGNYEILKLLLSKGAHVNAINLGATALHVAASNGRDDIVKLLLDHDAHVSIIHIFSF